LKEGAVEKDFFYLSYKTRRKKREEEGEKRSPNTKKESSLHHLGGRGGRRGLGKKVHFLVADKGEREERGTYFISIERKKHLLFGWGRVERDLGWKRKEGK